MLIMLLCVVSTWAQVRAGQTKDINITVGGANRFMKVHFPPNLKDNAPLVISMHGVNQSAEYQMNNTNWNNLADQNGFIVVFPQGEGLWWDVSGDKDVNFVKYIINYMSKNYKINKNRVYATGFSLGAMMTYHLITKTAGTFAAYGPVSGVCFDNRNITASRHVPLIHHHGSADDVFKFGGDPGHMAGGYPSITEYVTKWAAWNGCDTSKPVVKQIGGDTKTIWTNREEGIQTVYNVINGAGHWHSDSQWGGINTTNELWAFFKRYSLDNDISFAMSRIVPAGGSTISKDQTFTVAFSEYIYLKGVSVKLVGNGQTIELVNTTTTNSDKSRSLKLSMPEGASLSTGEYKLNIENVELVEDGRKGIIALDYKAEVVDAVSAPKAADDKVSTYSLSGIKDSSAKGIVIVKGNNGPAKKIIK